MAHLNGAGDQNLVVNASAFAACPTVGICGMPARPVGSQCGTVRMSHHSADRRSRLPSAPFRGIQRRQHRPGRAAETPAATAETAARRARPLESAWAHSLRSFRQSRPGSAPMASGLMPCYEKTLALVHVCVNRIGKHHRTALRVFVAAHSSIRLNFSQNKPDPRSEMRSNVLWKRRKIQRTNFDLLL